jgi:hypothetical protein
VLVLVLGFPKAQAEYDDEDDFQRTVIYLSPVLEFIAYPNSSEEFMTSSELSRRAFLRKSASVFAAAFAGVPQVVQALPKAATGASLNEDVCKAHLAPGTKLFE